MRFVLYLALVLTSAMLCGSCQSYADQSSIPSISSAAQGPDVYEGLTAEEYELLQTQKIAFEAKTPEEQKTALESGQVGCLMFRHLDWESAIDTRLIRLAGVDRFDRWVKERRQAGECVSIYSFADRFGFDCRTLCNIIAEYGLEELYPPDRLRIRFRRAGLPAEPSEGADADWWRGCDHFRRLAAAKGELVALVSGRVETYRAGRHPEPETHHPAWPEAFPPVSQLPQIESEKDFSIRQEADVDALGSVYAAVRIGDGYELRMTVARSRGADGNELWGSGDTFFVCVADPGFDNWVLSDTGR